MTKKSDKKQPWFKFYPQDWRGDAKLRMCSIGARGLWVEMLCVMHEAEPYGHLVIGGKNVAPKQIAALAGLSFSECAKYLVELELAGVCSRTEESKTIYSRRMVRDKAKADKDRENGKGGGNPKLLGEDKRGVNPQDKAQKPEAKSQSQTAAAEAVVLDEGQEKQFEALKALFVGIRSSLGWAIPHMEPVRLWLASGIAQGTISSAVTPILKRKQDMASLAYCDSAVRDAHGATPRLQVVSSRVWVDEGTPEWSCWQREYSGGRGSPVTDQRDENGRLTGRRGWYFDSLVPPGYDEVTCEKLAMKEEDAA
ncbi:MULTISPECIES: hypothetical protein [unclassified Bradyrhizobium]